MDKITVTIMEDGTLKLETDKVSAPNHINAERFLAEAAKLAGGKVAITQRTPHAHHGHSHGEGQHEHQTITE